MTQKQMGTGVVPGTGAAPAGHISKDLFCDWQEGRLKGEEEAGFLGHIGICTFCAERFGDWMEESFSMGEASLPEPPRYLKEEVLSKVQRMDVQAARKLKESSRQVQLMLYSLKVGLAVVASIFMLTVMADIQNMGLELKERKESQRMEQDLGGQMEGKREMERGREEGIAGSLKRGSREITHLLKELSNGWFRMDTGAGGAEDGGWD